MMKKLLLISMTLLLLSCNNNNGAVEEVSNEQPSMDELTAMSEEELVAMFQAADDVDILLIDVGASMSAQGAGAKQQIANISPQKPPYTPCKEICHLFIKGQGEILAHIGAFMGDGCSYYIFYENDRPKHLNGMTQKGIEFLNMIQSQVKARPVN